MITTFIAHHRALVWSNHPLTLKRFTEETIMVGVIAILLAIGILIILVEV